MKNGEILDRLARAKDDTADIVYRHTDPDDANGAWAANQMDLIEAINDRWEQLVLDIIDGRD